MFYYIDDNRNIGAGDNWRGQSPGSYRINIVSSKQRVGDPPYFLLLCTMDVMADILRKTFLARLVCFSLYPQLKFLYKRPWAM